MIKKSSFKLIVVCVLTMLIGINGLSSVRADATVYDYRSITYQQWAVVSYYFETSDRLVASWHVANDPARTLDVLILTETEFLLYSDGSPFTTVSEIINATSGYISLTAQSEGVLLTVFLANYSGVNVFYQVSIFRDVEINCTSNCNCTGITPQTSNPILIPGFSIAAISVSIIIAVIIVSYKLKNKNP